jgi:(1->4)-alpha-D-glucan 1-alpha-D-glucosylmutase
MRIPVATYRIQFTPGFGFKKAHEIVPYLSELGISDIYASPVFKAKRGSPHGYDVVDMNQLNPDLGSEDDFDALADNLKKSDIGWVQDIVPNHMAFDGENKMLTDVLEHGSFSGYHDFFDIEWDHAYESLRNRLLAPFLGRLYSESLDAREIVLQYNEDGFSINYYSLKLPVKIESYTMVLTHRFNVLRKTLGAEHPDFIKLLGILYSLKNLPLTKEEKTERYRHVQFIKRILWELYTKNDNIKQLLNDNIEIFNGGKAPEEDLSLLDNLHSEQLFRLSFWKVATEEINYRRFFNINGLISLRMEDDRVFHFTHGLIFDLIEKKRITGLRIDHIDGLYDPTAYLRKLREKADNIYLVVEKILQRNEDIHALWPVQGTTGYDYLNYLNGIFCDVKNGRRFNKIYYTFTGFKTSYEAILYEKKKLVIEKDMTGDVDNLAHLLKRISSRDRYGSDITLYGLKRAIIEFLSLLPVYRTYISSEVPDKTDSYYITETMNKAREMNPGLLYELHFIEQFLLLRFSDPLSEDEKKERLHFVMRFQQFSGPLMAKGFEDTTLYIYNRLLSLNEVGGNPETFGVSLKEFHTFQRKRARKQPYSMNSTSTHDTKRGEDIKARINVLSEKPELWESHIKKWSALNRKIKKIIKGIAIPDKNDEYFLYQTLIGALPFNPEEHENFKGRLKEYVIKAVREAKVHTAWLKPDIDYEENFISFIESILNPAGQNQFLKEFTAFQKMVSYFGIFNSLSQTLIKITSPGTPDFYQGTEIWDLNLVDPDNRRPVDFQMRMTYLQDIKKRLSGDTLQFIRDLFSTKEDGRIKLFLIYRALTVRHTNRTLFEKGAYIPLKTEGRYRDSIVAFARERKPFWSLTITPRFLTRVIENGQYPFGREVWDDTHIILPDDAPSEWYEEISGTTVESKQTLHAGDALKHFSCALLTGKNQHS